MGEKISVHEIHRVRDLVRERKNGIEREKERHKPMLGMIENEVQGRQYRGVFKLFG